MSTINGFDALLKITKVFENFSSPLIKRLTQHAPNGEFPDFKETIEFFKVNHIKISLSYGYVDVCSKVESVLR